MHAAGMSLVASVNSAKLPAVYNSESPVTVRRLYYSTALRPIGPLGHGNVKRST